MSEEEHATFNSPNANYETPAVGLSRKAAEDTSPIPPPDFNEKPKREALSPQSNDISATSAKSSTESPTSDELKARLAEAEGKLKTAQQGLRQRKPDTKETSAPMVQQQQSPPSGSGVPIQLVAGLCLLSFLIAYFFF